MIMFPFSNGPLAPLQRAHSRFPSWEGRRKSRRVAKPVLVSRRRLRLEPGEAATLERGYVLTRQQRKRRAFELYFAEITAQYGGEPRKNRRAIAWAKARKFRPA